MTACPVCLEESTKPHPACLVNLFGEERIPTLDLELSKIHTAGLAMIGRASLPGVQRKLAVSLSDAPTPTLRVDGPSATLILKPQSQAFPAVP